MPSLSVVQTVPSLRRNEAPADSSPPKPTDPSNSPGTKYLKPTGTSISVRSSDWTTRSIREEDTRVLPIAVDSDHPGRCVSSDANHTAPLVPEGAWRCIVSGHPQSASPPAPDVICDVRFAHCYGQSTGLPIQRGHELRAHGQVREVGKTVRACRAGRDTPELLKATPSALINKLPDLGSHIGIKKASAARGDTSVDFRSCALMWWCPRNMPRKRCVSMVMPAGALQAGW